MDNYINEENTDMAELVTIGITSFNAIGTISKAIESAFSQNWENKEILIVDDASSDGSVEHIKNIIKGLSNVRLIVLNNNLGVANARNIIIQNANGSFICFFDDDDISNTERVQIQYNRICEAEQKFNSYLIICHTSRIQQFPNGGVHYESTIGMSNGVRGHKISDRILFGKVDNEIVGSCATCSQMARKSTYLELRGFDPNLRRSEDTDLIVRLGLMNGIVVGISKPLVIQQMTLGNEKTLLKEHEAMKDLLIKHEKYLKEKGWFEFILIWHDARLSWARKEYKQFLFFFMKLLYKYPYKLFQKVLWSIPASKSRATRNKFLKEIK